MTFHTPVSLCCYLYIGAQAPHAIVCFEFRAPKHDCFTHLLVKVICFTSAFKLQTLLCTSNCRAPKHDFFIHTPLSQSCYFYIGVQAPDATFCFEVRNPKHGRSVKVAIFILMFKLGPLLFTSSFKLLNISHVSQSQ